MQTVLTGRTCRSRWATFTGFAILTGESVLAVDPGQTAFARLAIFSVQTVLTGRACRSRWATITSFSVFSWEPILPRDTR